MGSLGFITDNPLSRGVGDVLSPITGNKNTPGILGTGQFHADQVAIDPNAYKNPVGDQSANWNAGMQGMLGATTGTAPQMQAAQLGGASTYGGAQIGQTSQAGAANMGPTATYGGTHIDASQYSNIMQQQQNAANQQALQAMGQGPSMAQAQAQQSALANMQQQAALLGSQRGSSNPALAQRQALDSMSLAQGQAAAQAVQGRTAEVLGAQQNYATQLSNMQNQASAFAQGQAGLTQQANLASMQGINAQNAAQAQLSQQNNQFNSGQVNSQNLNQAQLLQQAGLSNQADQNQFMLQQGQMNQQANANNQNANMAQNQLNAQQYNDYQNLLQQQNLAQYQGNMAQQDLAVKQNLGIQGINSGAYQSAAGNNQALVGGVFQGAGGAAVNAATSDRKAKINIKRASRQLGDFLDTAYQAIETGKKLRRLTELFI